MREEVFQKAMDKAGKQIYVLVDEQRGKILKAMSDALMESDPDKTFKFNLSFKVTLEPQGAETKVETTLGYSVAHKCTHIPEIVSATEEMDFTNEG
jgi:hypothetical protein